MLITKARRCSNFVNDPLNSSLWCSSAQLAAEEKKSFRYTISRLRPLSLFLKPMDFPCSSQGTVSFGFSGFGQGGSNGVLCFDPALFLGGFGHLFTMGRVHFLLWCSAGASTIRQGVIGLISHRTKRHYFSATEQMVINEVSAYV